MEATKRTLTYTVIAPDGRRYARGLSYENAQNRMVVCMWRLDRKGREQDYITIPEGPTLSWIEVEPTESDRAAYQAGGDEDYPENSGSY